MFTKVLRERVRLWEGAALSSPLYHLLDAPKAHATQSHSQGTWQSVNLPNIMPPGPEHSHCP